MKAKPDLATLSLVGRLGAAGPEHLAAAHKVSEQAAQRRLRRLTQAGLLEQWRLLHGASPVFVASRSGLQAAGLGHLPICRVSPASVGHLRACAAVAVSLEAALPAATLMTERELVAWEGMRGHQISVVLRSGARAEWASRHRPDMVVWPLRAGRPVAVEVELTVKAARRLRAIVRAWARCRTAAGVVYHAAPAAARAVERAIAAERAEQSVWVSELGDTARLAELIAAAGGRSTSYVSSTA